VTWRSLVLASLTLAKALPAIGWTPAPTCKSQSQKWRIFFSDDLNLTSDEQVLAIDWLLEEAQWRPFKCEIKQILLDGHAGLMEDQGIAMGVSLKRAAFIRELFVDKGAKRSKISSRGFASNVTDREYNNLSMPDDIRDVINRRVEISIIVGRIEEAPPP